MISQIPAHRHQTHVLTAGQILPSVIDTGSHNVHTALRKKEEKKLPDSKTAMDKIWIEFLMHHPRD